MYTRTENRALGIDIYIVMDAIVTVKQYIIKCLFATIQPLILQSIQLLVHIQ